MDLDTTLKNLPLTPETIEKAIKDICNMDADDNVEFTFMSLAPIRDDDVYGGYRVSLNARYDTIIAPLSIDVSTAEALAATASHRGTEQQISDINTIITNLTQSKELRQMWNNYRKQFSYASDIEYDAIISVVSGLVES